MATLCSFSPTLKRSHDDDGEMLCAEEDSYVKRMRNNDYSFSDPFGFGLSQNFPTGQGVESNSSSSSSSSMSSSEFYFKSSFSNNGYGTAIDEENESPMKRNQHSDGFRRSSSTSGSCSSCDSGSVGGGGFSRSSSFGRGLEKGTNSGISRNKFIFDKTEKKRLRFCDGSDGVCSGSKDEAKVPANSAHMRNMYETQLATYRKDMAKKDMEVLSLNSRVSTMNEENKILKRAVAIQESRQRELYSSNQRLESTLQQAVQHIQSLEKVIQSLRTQIYDSSHSGPNFMLEKPPPDVY